MKYKTKNIRTNEEKNFRSMKAISDFYENITEYNLSYHFSKCKKTSVVINEIWIERFREENK
jgi:hypothetical protein